MNFTATSTLCSIGWGVFYVLGILAKRAPEMQAVSFMLGIMISCAALINYVYKFYRFVMKLYRAKRGRK